jgi:hypothetical protein
VSQETPVQILFINQNSEPEAANFLAELLFESWLKRGLKVDDRLEFDNREALYPRRRPRKRAGVRKYRE